MKKIAFLTIFLTIFLYAKTVTLKECIQKAIQNYPNIKKYMLQIKANEENIGIAKSDYLPQLSFHAEYDPTKTYITPIKGKFNSAYSDGWQLSATLQQKIWDFKKTIFNIKAKENQKDISKLSLDDEKALLSYMVKMQYELILLQKEAIKTREQDLKTKIAFLNQAKALQKEGMKTKADVSRFLSSVYEAKNSLSIEKAKFKKALYRLSSYIREPVDDNTSFVKTDAKFKDKKDEILDNSLTLKMLKKTIKSSEYSYKSIKASKFGSINLLASYSRQNSLNLYNSHFIGIEMNIPINFKISKETQKAYINKKINIAAYKTKLIDIKNEVEDLLIDLKRYKETISAKKSQIDAALQTKRVIEARYRVGMATYLEVLDTIKDLLNARLALIKAKFEKEAIIYKLKYLEGKLL